MMVPLIASSFLASFRFISPVLVRCQWLLSLPFCTSIADGETKVTLGGILLSCWWDCYLLVTSLSLESRERQPIHSLVIVQEAKRTLEDIPFSTKSDNSPVITIFISLLLNLGRKRDSTHNPISKLLIENRLVSIAIVLHNLIQSVDKGFLGWHFDGPTTIGEAVELFLQRLLGDEKQIGQLFDIFRWRFGLAVEYGSCGYFIATEVLANFLEA